MSGTSRSGSVQDWARFCRLLDDDSELLASVETAAADPDADPWLAVIDGLDDAGALAYLETQDFGGELVDALAGLPRVFRTSVDLGPVADIDDLPDAIAAADLLLAQHDLRVVFLEEDSDAFPLVVVAASDAETIVDLAAQLGHQARVF
ncbi:hypothetical protein ACI7YT_16615 [Microbacterium sp. M]|uniref:DUF6630 family protein n=1 Tax=Microbacterium sp. M TaxID=3377125 RepID=UPI0038686B4E